MTRYKNISGGAGSWLMSKIDMANHPDADHRFIFADTLYEDADAYRLLIEGTANLLGRRITVPRADEFPDYRLMGEFDIADYAGNPEWRAFLADLRAYAASELPELIWLVEGRDPWEVFRDKRFLGNSRIDPCSYELKRQTLEAWVKENANPSVDVFCVGIGTHERHRFEGRDGSRGLRRRMEEKGLKYEAPLIDTIEGEIGPFVYLSKAGISRPRLYKFHAHNNCGGFCIKAGIGHYNTRMIHMPERMAYDAMMERKISEWVGQPVAMVTDRRGGDKVPFTLARMIEEWDDMPDGMTEDFFAGATEGDSGCGCMVDGD